jgi:hypothetical protein
VERNMEKTEKGRLKKPSEQLLGGPVIISAPPHPAENSQSRAR